MHRQDSTVGIYCSIINVIDVFLYAIGHYMYIDLLTSFSINSYRIFHHNYAYAPYAYVDGLYKKVGTSCYKTYFYYIKNVWTGLANSLYTHEKVIIIFISLIAK